MGFAINTFYSAHEIYVGTYEVLGAAASFFWERVPRILPDRLRQGLGRIGPAIRERASQAVVSVIQRFHQTRRQPIYRAALRDLRPEMEELEDVRHQALHSLSQLCSYAFERPLIFSSNPTVEDLDVLEEHLNGLLQNPEVGGSRRIAAEQAMFASQKFRAILEETRALREEDISVQDYEGLLQRLQSNYLLVSSYWAVLENVGEYVGGLIVDESASLLPAAFNPAIFLASHFREHFAAPLGRFSGAFLTLASIYYLIGKIPSLQQNRLAIGALAAAALIGLEHLQSNPISNYVETAMGQLGYDFAFYSVMLIFSYLGMWLTGTPERLADYTRNMTFSMISYRASQAALDVYGAGPVANLTVPLIISHFAYNASTYRDVIQQRMLEDYTFTRERNALAAIDARTIRAAKRNLLSIATREGIPKIEEMIAENGAVRLAELLQLPPQAEKNFINALHEKCMQGIQILRLTEQAMNHPDFVRWMENAGEIRWLAEEDNSHFIDFVIRELTVFLQIIETEPMRRFIEGYKTNLLDLMRHSSMRDPENGLNDERQIIQRLWIRTFIAEQYQGPFLNEATLFAQQIFNEENGDHHRFIQDVIEPFLRYYLDLFFPLIPSVSREEKICAEHLMQMLLNLFAISLMIKLLDGQIDYADLQTPLQREELIQFSRDLTHFVLQQQYPGDAGFSKKARRSLVNRLLQSQLR